MSKPNCYSCKHRRSIPGNCHISCKHPAIASVFGHPLAEFVVMGGGIPPVLAEVIGVTAHEHGIRSGWFSWPFNFDPNWLVTCNGHETDS